MLTEDQINEAGLLAIEAEYGTAKKDMIPFSAEIESASGYGRGFCKGVEYAQEQLSPKWVPCTHKEVLQPGRYFLKLYNPATKTGMERYHEIRNAQEIRYFFVTHYLKFEIPICPAIDGK